MWDPVFVLTWCRTPMPIPGGTGFVHLMAVTSRVSAPTAPTVQAGPGRLMLAGSWQRPIGWTAEPIARLRWPSRSVSGSPHRVAGRIADRWRALTALGVGDLTAARVVEAHTDALAIVAEAESAAAGDRSLADFLAQTADRSSTWGVFAAEGPGVRVDARPAGGCWLLTGTKPWCSLAGRLSHAMVTAHTGSGTRRLFAIDLRHPAVTVLEAGWVARGLTEVVSGPIELFDCPAVPVGPDGWYLERPGFAWGGIGVAACWYGGAVGLARTLRESYRTREPDQIGAMHLGAVDAVLTGARAVLGQAAVAVGHGRGRGADGALWASRVRAVVARAAEEVIERVGHALGPAPLVGDERHARRVADLQLYLRQDHAERDDAALGRQVLGLTDWPW